MDDLPAFLAGVAASAAVYAHGIVGHRWWTAQLGPVELLPTRLWGDGDMSRRVFGAVWHIVTAVFLVSAVTLFLAAFGAVESPELLRFIAVAFTAFFGVGLVFLAGRLDAILKPFPAVVVASLVGVSVLAWVASSRSP